MGVYSRQSGNLCEIPAICWWAHPGRIKNHILPKRENKMALKFASHELDGITVLALDGRIVLGEETVALREKVKSLLGDGKKNIVLDLKNVTMIDSSGLGALVAAHSSAPRPELSIMVTFFRSRTIFFLPSPSRLFTFSRSATVSSPRTIRPSSASTVIPSSSWLANLRAILFSLFGRI